MHSLCQTLFICNIHLDCFTALPCFGFGMDLDGKVLATVSPKPCPSLPNSRFEPGKFSSGLAIEACFSRTPRLIMFSPYGRFLQLCADAPLTGECGQRTLGPSSILLVLRTNQHYAFRTQQQCEANINKLLLNLHSYPCQLINMSCTLATYRPAIGLWHL